MRGRGTHRAPRGSSSAGTSAVATSANATRNVVPKAAASGSAVCDLAASWIEPSKPGTRDAIERCTTTARSALPIEPATRCTRLTAAVACGADLEAREREIERGPADEFRASTARRPDRGGERKPRRGARALGGRECADGRSARTRRTRSRTGARRPLGQRLADEVRLRGSVPSRCSSADRPMSFGPRPRL